MIYNFFLLNSKRRRSIIRQQKYLEILDLARMAGVSKEEMKERLREEKEKKRREDIDERRRVEKMKRQGEVRVVDFELDEHGRPVGAPRVRMNIDFIQPIYIKFYTDNN